MNYTARRMGNVLRITAGELEPRMNDDFRRPCVAEVPTYLGSGRGLY